MALTRGGRHPELDPALVELVDLRASQMNACAYCLQLHVNKARKHGVAPAKLTQLAAWHESEAYSGRERIALALTEAMTRIDPAQGVPDAVFEAARQEFGDAVLAILVAKILAINAWNRLMLTYRIAAPAAEE